MKNIFETTIIKVGKLYSNGSLLSTLWKRQASRGEEEELVEKKKFIGIFLLFDMPFFFFLFLRVVE
jgi:hypothetical protein